MILWPDLYRPAALWLIPALWGLLYLIYRLSHRRNQWEHRLPQAFHAVLLSPTSSRGQPWPWYTLALASLFLGLSLSSPHWSAYDEADANVQPPPLVLVLELTPAMLSTDLLPTRLQQLQRKALHILQLRQHAASATVVYAGSAHTLTPLSNDALTSEHLLQAISPALMPVAGQRADLGIKQALHLLQQGAYGHGQILLFTHALSTTEQQGIQALLARSAVRLTILGVGTPQGAPLIDENSRRFDPQHPLSQLDEAGLQAFAKRMAADYSRLTADSHDLEQLQWVHHTEQGQQLQPTPTPNRDQGYWFILPLLFVLAPLARKGWLMGVPLLVLLAQSPDSHAFDLRRLLTPVSPLERILIDPQRALQQLHDPLWRGIAAYHAQDYALAVMQLAQLDTPLAHYNRGNALMQLGRYEDAILAYQHALALNPELTYAQDNLALAQQLHHQLEAPAAQPTDSPQHSATQPDSSALNEQDSAANNAKLPTSPPSFQHSDPDAWLEQIPDHPGELLRRKFWYEQFNAD